jgi:UDP-2,3-diacylglucosamine pyrophosphatase LpxH
VILLISDLHLEEERPDITRAFLDLLDGRARSARRCTFSATSSRRGLATTP